MLAFRRKLQIVDYNTSLFRETHTPAIQFPHAHDENFGSLLSHRLSSAAINFVIKDMKKDMKVKREGFTWFESVWRWVQTLWISQPKERKPWLQKKDMKKVLMDLNEVNTRRRDFMEELDKLKCSTDDVRSVLFVENWMEMAISFKACFGGSSWKYDYNKMIVTSIMINDFTL
ncbi:hypothetical protein Tco_1418034 [Tanacetum coccineum]